MRQRLSAADLPALRALTARRPDPPLDPALALLDAWACLGHVLGFYGDRLVNEHYLRTCLHRRSAVELGRLVGYAARPGVAADVHLAFTLDDLDPEAELEVPAGTRAYSQPGPGETMQPFETVERLTGRPRWSLMHPRRTAPQRVGADTLTLHLKGTATGLRTGDTLLVEVGEVCAHHTVATVEALFEEDRTRVVLEQRPEPGPAREPVTVGTGLLQALLRQPASTVGDPAQLEPDLGQLFRPDSYAAYGMVAGAHPQLGRLLSVALGGTAHADPTNAVKVYAMRVKAALHGHNAQLIPLMDTETRLVKEYLEWKDDGSGATVGGEGIPSWPADSVPSEGAEKQIALDSIYDAILPGSWVVITPPAKGEETASFHKVAGVGTVTRTAFNLPARVTLLTLETAWRDKVDGEGQDGEGEGEGQPPPHVGPVHRRTVVHAQSERLELADVPITEDVCAGELELDGYYPGLRPGRRVIVTGERTDLLPHEESEEPGEQGTERQEVTGVLGTELVMISSVQHKADGPAPRGEGDGDGEAAVEAQAATRDTVHTVLGFAEPLRYCYRRETVRVLGNVAHATHGESRAEVLGGGDATPPLQAFPLRQGPLTHLPAPTMTGTAASLEVRVNDLRWHEASNAAAVAPGERAYVLQTDEDGTTRVVFGLGARLPTGSDNVRASYRGGLGVEGNARAGQISVLASRPNGVTAVTNPLPAGGGAGPDDVDSIRQRVPVGLTALDRLVSATDLEDFARAFAGIGKARVATVPGPPTTRYTLTVAAVDDAPLRIDSALLENLCRALSRFGDLQERLEEPAESEQPKEKVLHTLGWPDATVTIRIRTALLLGIRARIRTLADHPWETVHPRLRNALLRTFGFRAREIGQVPHPGEAMAVMQGVRGVAWVDLVAFGTIETGPPDAPRSPAEVAQAAANLLGGPGGPGLPELATVGEDQIAYLSPDAPGTLLLELAEEPQP
ncbi:hypothetical protein [Geodermatophilus sp. SYSU D01105]